MLKKVAIVVGEQSGDILGAGLIAALKKQFPDCQFEGIGGELMIKEGFNSLYPLDRLAVMGFVEPFKRLPELLSMRKALKKRYVNAPPDVFIGIDSPDFNLNLERFIKQKVGAPAVHYVSPSVWAWRKGRIKSIKKSIDLMLTLFPFESDFYSQNNIKNACVGHPLADDISLKTDTELNRSQLGIRLAPHQKLIALLPGSRRGEVEHLCKPFLDAAALLYKEDSDLSFVLPAANASRLAQIELCLQEGNYTNLPIKIILGQSRVAMASSDAIMIASGTATLEALLLKKPMVIAYKTAPFSFFLLSRLVNLPFIGLPNILNGTKLVEELIQNDVTSDHLSQYIKAVLYNASQKEALIRSYTEIHLSIKKDASKEAASHIASLVKSQMNQKNVI